MKDLFSSYQLMRASVGAAWIYRDVISIEGQDVESFLQSQISQDLSNVEVGHSAWSWLLQPHGKVDALIRLYRLEPAKFIIDVDQRFGDSVIERLERFKLRAKVSLQQLDWKVLALRGPAAGKTKIHNGLAINADWNGTTGIDVFGQNPSADAELCDPEAYEAIRIESGFPAMGAELDEKTIPAEADINSITISFKKGCYTGQELVARIESRGGNVPRHLRGLMIETDDPAVKGAKIMPLSRQSQTVKPLGTVTSCAYSPGFGKCVGLAFIRRDTLIPTEAHLVTDEGEIEVRVENLPLK